LRIPIFIFKHAKCKMHARRDQAAEKRPADSQQQQTGTSPQPYGIKEDPAFSPITDLDRGAQAEQASFSPPPSFSFSGSFGAPPDLQLGELEAWLLQLSR
jgi:hypothetical protein